MSVDRREILAFEPVEIAENPGVTLKRIFTANPTEDDIVYACTPFALGYIPPELLRDRAQRFPLRPRSWGFGDPVYFYAADLAKFYSGIFTSYYREAGEVTPAARKLILALAQDYAQSHSRFDISKHPTLADLVNISKAPQSAQPVEKYPTAEQRLDAIARARISGLVENPYFIAQPVALETLEALADIQEGEPWSFQMYTYYTGKFGYQLLPEIGQQHIEPFARIVNSDRLWAGKNRELRRLFFSSVAEALTLLAEKYPEETFGPRLELLKRNQGISKLNHPGENYPHAEITHHLVYSFRTSGEKAQLDAEEKRATDPGLSEVIRRIQTGGYNNTLWAV